MNLNKRLSELERRAVGQPIVEIVVILDPDDDRPGIDIDMPLDYPPKDDTPQIAPARREV